MTDRIVSCLWWFVVMALITSSGIVALFVGYRGLLELLAARCETGTIWLAIGVALGAAALQLARHRNDLL